MKALPFLSIALGLALLGTGCVRYYNITTNSGRIITSHGKPHYDKANGVFVFKDVQDQERRIPAGSVAGISPASDKENTQGFNPKPSR